MSTPPPKGSLNTNEPPASTPPAPDAAVRLSPGEAGTLPEVAPSGSAAAVEVPGYEILGELGRGGMGAVFKGRDPELGRDLAVKVLLEEHHDDPRTVGRFREEAQIGGQLQHPGVVPIYAMGRLADGRPYFTMKLIEGRTLAALLQERESPVHELPRFLKVFEQICQTLAYAHSKGVIHRDLKPLNVMVGAFGEAQVMDWGLAKVLRAGAIRTVRSGRPEAESQVGSVIGTPAYMAPEQACGDVEGLDARCDVFGLGAVLCEILTGAPPYRGRETGELLRKAARADLADAFGRLDGCGTDAELVALVKVCLAAEPADRPRDAGAAAAAMTAYLAGVQERLRQAELAKAAAQARAAEERKRRRLMMALAATVLLAVVGAGVGALWYQQDRAARAAEDARLATARTAEDARLAAEHARKAAVTERDVTAALEAAKTRGKDAAALRDDPARWGAGLAAALSAVEQADGVLSAGVDDTGQLRSRVAAVREELEAADRDRRMIAGLEEARFRKAAAGHEGGFDVAGAAALYRAAFRHDDKDWDALGADEAAGHINQRAIREDLLAALADWSSITPNEDDAQRLRRVLQAADPDPASFRNRWNAALERRDWDTLQVLAINPEMKDQPAARLVIMATGWCDAGDPAGAVNLLKDANERHPGDFWINYWLGYAHWKTKPAAVDEEIRYFTAGVTLRPNSAGAHNSLGSALYDKHQWDEAVMEYRKAIQIQPGFAPAHYNLGIALYGKHQWDEAIAEYRKAIQIQPDYAMAHTNLGAALWDKGQWDEAITEYRTAIQVRPDLATAHNNLGIALRRKDQVDEAVTEYRTAIQIQPDFALAHNNLGFALRLKGQLDEAITEYRTAIKIQPDYAEAHTNLGFALRLKGQLDEAITEYRKGLQIQPDNAEAHTNLGFALRDKGQLDEAITEFHAAIQIKPDLAPAHYNLGNALRDKGQLDEAIAEFRKAIQIQPDDPEAWCNLGGAFRLQRRFTESLAAYRRGHQLGSQKPNWSHSSAQWVREAEDLAERDALLPAILRGEAAPSDAVQQFRFADFCQRYKRLYATASRFYGDAFSAEPGWADDLRSGARYNAARAAALAGCGQGEDADKTDEKERASLRKQAGDWLRADLALWTRVVDGGAPADRAAAAKMLQHWKDDADLAGVRDADALAQLPAEEQDGWRKLWADVDAALKKAQAK